MLLFLASEDQIMQAELKLDSGKMVAWYHKKIFRMVPHKRKGEIKNAKTEYWIQNITASTISAIIINISGTFFTSFAVIDSLVWHPDKCW